MRPQQGLGYSEDQYSLPRWEDLTVSRAGMYDDTYHFLPTQGWMQVPLVDYHGGGDAAAFEQLSDHPEAFEMALAQYVGYGVAACWRGPRIYDSDATKALVDKWVGFYRQHRQLLTSDIVHVRRADGQGLDAILHVDPFYAPPPGYTPASATAWHGAAAPSTDVLRGKKAPPYVGATWGPERAILLVFNPTDAAIEDESLAVNLYYAGIELAAAVFEGPGPGPLQQQQQQPNGEPTLLRLNRRYEATVLVSIEPRSAKWFLIYDASSSAD